MVAYSATELCSVNCNGDVHKPTRSLRKLLFDLQLWVPLNIRSTLLHLDRLFTSAVNNNQNSNSITTAASYVNVITSTAVPKSKNLSFGTWNIRSLSKRFSSVAEAISDKQLDILAVTETWHRDSDDVALRRSAPAGYRIIDVRRSPALDRGFMAVE